MIGIAIILGGILLISCGPSTEQQSATTVTKTAVATTSTPIPTSTPTPTSTSTATVTQAWLQPRMITPGPSPTLVPLGERYITHFLERGFEYFIDQDQYMKSAGRGVLVIKVHEEGQTVGYVVRNPMTEEEIAMVKDHLREAGEFLDPGHGYATIQSALQTLSWGITDNGTAWLPGGREIHWFGQQSHDTEIAIFTFMNTPTYIGTEID